MSIVTTLQRFIENGDQRRLALKKAADEYWASMPRWAKLLNVAGYVAILLFAASTLQVLTSLLAWLVWDASWAAHRTRRFKKSFGPAIIIPLVMWVAATLAVPLAFAELQDEKFQKVLFGEELLSDKAVAEEAASLFYDQVAQGNAQMVYVTDTPFPFHPDLEILANLVLEPALESLVDTPPHVQAVNLVALSATAKSSEVFGLIPKSYDWMKGREGAHSVMMVNCIMGKDGDPLLVTPLPQGNAVNAVDVPELSKVAEACSLAKELAKKGKIEVDKSNVMIMPRTPWSMLMDAVKSGPTEQEDEK
ncbi:hypothetical protein [Salipiger sp. PrR003]|uniref:hypothetical protein n=1 Tax=Salipiger sp. PrR003 TaxID=2706776 RepID=UPI0013DA6DCA|nr:hypothetical protein [Salipiger sp. PrR003]NDV50410.1 hypothetical protein [Salipiger sp. PrR003]